MTVDCRGQEGRKQVLTKVKLDQEWYRLIVKAKQMGFSVDDIRMFLQQAVTSDREKKEGE